MKRILIQDTLSISVSTINNKKVVEVITNGKGMIFSSENTGIAVDEMEKEIIDFIDNVPYLKEHSLRRIQIFKTEPHFEIILDK